MTVLTACRVLMGLSALFVISAIWLVARPGTFLKVLTTVSMVACLLLAAGILALCGHTTMAALAVCEAVTVATIVVGHALVGGGTGGVFLAK